MKILVIHNFYQNTGGEDAVVKNEVKMLRENGSSVRLFSMDNRDILNFGFFKKMLFVFNAFFGIKTIIALRKIVREFRPEVAHIHNVLPLISCSAYIYLKLAGIHIVQTVHNFRFICANGLFYIDGENCERCLRPSLYSLKKKCFRKNIALTLMYDMIIGFWRYSGLYSFCINKFICLNEFGKDKMIKAGYPKDKIIVKGNFVEMSSARFRTKDVSEKYCLYLGRLSDEKGIAVLLKAFSGICLLKLRIAGDGPLRGKVEASDNRMVDYLGFVTGAKKAELIRDAEFIIIPSVCYENFPVVIKEAAMLKIPAAVSNIGGLPELVKDRITGILFKPNDAVDLKDKIEYLARSPEICKKMGESAFSNAQEDYSKERHYQALLSIYNNAGGFNVRK
ncbi:MAG: glycosyltransferase family 4 protein [Candidatus Omnitrophota bacterium]|nr:glycosyltransferase family 4 protein [Candidatus Omnitrophota bacterium]